MSRRAATRAEFPSKFQSGVGRKFPSGMGRKFTKVEFPSEFPTVSTADDRATIFRVTTQVESRERPRSTG